MPLSLVPALLMLPYPWAELQPAKAWTDKASLSFVALAGNAQSQSLGFSNEFRYAWPTAALAVTASGVRVNTTTITRVAEGTGPGDYTVRETRTSATTSEAYNLGVRYDRKITGNTFWFTQVGWDQNRPSGLQSRTNLTGGFGHAWVDRPATKVRMDLGLGYTREQRVFDTPGFDESTGSWRVAARVDHAFNAASGFSTEFAFTDNLQDSRDTLTVWKNALTAKLNGSLALKVGLDLTYDNTPASVGVDLVQTGSNPPVVLGQVPFLLKKLDSVFTTSVVLTF